MKSEKDEVIIKLSKTKIVLLIGGSILIVVISIWLWTNADNQVRRDPIFIKGILLVSILFSGMCAIYGFNKLFDKRPGLIINHEGILDNTSAVSGDIVMWSDIKHFDILQIQKTKFLLIFVDNPEVYIDKANKFKKLLMKANMKIYGTPLSISSTTLQCDFDELVRIINDRRKNTFHK